jgi:uncharacterized protein involved in response to NO
MWALGFRPFYLLAGLLAVLSIGLWVAQLAGWTGGATPLRGPLWHAHEMIFGYAFAVIVGFLFTAGRNWSGQPTPSGGALALIAGLWLAARLLVLGSWPLPAAIADGAFAIAAAIGLARPLVAAGNRRNYFFVALLLAIGAANLGFHLAMAGLAELPVRRALQLGLDLVLFIMVVMGGRVIPMFTANGAQGSKPQRLPWIEHASLGSVLALLAADALGAPGIATGGLAAIAGVSNGARLVLWQPWRTLRHPMVWILHASYAWLAISLLLRALAALDLLAPSLAAHAFTVGAVGGLTLGMMTRTARGHSGLRLEPGRLEIAAYLLLQLAVLLRVFLPLAAPGLYLDAVIASGMCWSLAFSLFLWRFWPVLTRPRIDGREG